VRSRARRTKRQRALPRLLAAGAALVFAFALAAAPLDPPLFSQDPEVVCPGYTAVERTSYETTAALWPPGASDCDYTTPTGAVRHSTYMPWLEYVFLTLLVASVALAFASVKRATSRRGARFFAAAAVVLGLATIAAIGPWAALVVPPMLLAIALALALASGVRYPGRESGPQGPV
jgi:hypothetical protein